jgi:hypothetical protein
MAQSPMKSLSCERVQPRDFWMLVNGSAPAVVQIRVTASGPYLSLRNSMNCQLQ